MKILRNSIIFLSFILFVSCNKGYYVDSGNRYKIKYPQGYLALNSNIDREGQEAFLSKVSNQITVLDYEGMDVVFCDPLDERPDYNAIKINTIKGYVNLNKVREQEFQNSLIEELSRRYDRVRILSVDDSFVTGNYQTIRIDFEMQLDNTYLNASFIMIAGSIFGTQVLTVFYKPVEKSKMDRIIKEMLLSYRKR